MRPRLAAILAAGFLLAAVGGCAGSPTGPPFSPLTEPGPGDTLVYIWRHDSLGGVDPVDVRLNGQKLGKMKNGEYLTVLVDPGQHELRARLRWLDLIPRSWNGLGFKARPGQTLFLRIWAQYRRGPDLPHSGTAPGRQESNTELALFIAPWEAGKALEELSATRRAPGQ